MQTILGSGGAIGKELARVLPEYTSSIRLVSRNPEKINPGDELHRADLLDAEQTSRAVTGSKVVYLTAGLNYSVKTWQEQWPVVMQNTIEACATHGARLIFFDNIYMYSKDCLSNITEDATIDPPSKKGKVRAAIANMVMDAHASGKIQAAIARSADFYGPDIQQTSMLTETVINPLKEGKKANWLGGLNFKHSFTFTPDAAKATALLGNTDAAYGQAWHLPTASNPPTGEEWVKLVAKALGTKPRVQVAPKFMVRILGLFTPIMGELVEMMYQYDQDYIFNSTKIEKAFNLTPTLYSEGINQVIHN